MLEQSLDNNKGATGNGGPNGYAVVLRGNGAQGDHGVFVAVFHLSQLWVEALVM